MLANALLSLVERIINQLLPLDPLLQGKLAAIADKQLLIEVRDWQQSILCVYSDEQIHLYSTQERSFDCMISADINTLLALKDPSMLTQLIRQDKLDLQGDLNLAQGFSNAFAELDIDAVKTVGTGVHVLLHYAAFIGEQWQGGILKKLFLGGVVFGRQGLLDELHTQRRQFDGETGGVGGGRCR